MYDQEAKELFDKVLKMNKKEKYRYILKELYLPHYVETIIEKDRYIESYHSFSSSTQNYHHMKHDLYFYIKNNRIITNMARNQIYSAIKVSFNMNVEMPFCTKTIFRKILNGTIKNEDQVVEAWLKLVKLKDISVKDVRNVMNSSYYNGDIYRLLKNFINVEDEDVSYISYNLLELSDVLNKKINASWEEEEVKKVKTKWLTEVKYENNS